jgi:hypothetical protein
VGVGDTHQVEHALHRPILAGVAVQRVEHDVRAMLLEHARDVAVHVDFGDARPAALAQCLGDPWPLISETERSDDQPPIRTTTMEIAVHFDTPTR